MPKKVKHPRRLPVTPNSQIRAALRMLSLRCREIAQAKKEQNNTCQICGRKGSVSKDHPCKTNMHHRNGIRWAEMLACIRKELLQTPADYVCMCDTCHIKHHKDEMEAEECD